MGGNLWRIYCLKENVRFIHKIGGLIPDGYQLQEIAESLCSNKVIQRRGSHPGRGPPVGGIGVKVQWFEHGKRQEMRINVIGMG